MRIQCNQDVRLRIVTACLHYHDVAKAMGVSEETFTDWLKYDLPKERKATILKTIDRIKPTYCD